MDLKRPLNGLSLITKSVPGAPCFSHVQPISQMVVAMRSTSEDPELRTVHGKAACKEHVVRASMPGWQPASGEGGLQSWSLGKRAGPESAAPGRGQTSPRPFPEPSSAAFTLQKPT